MITIKINPHIPFYKRFLKVLYAYFPVILFFILIMGIARGFDNIHSYLIALAGCVLNPRVWRDYRYLLQLDIDENILTIHYCYLWRRKISIPIKNIEIHYSMPSNKKNHFIGFSKVNSSWGANYDIGSLKFLNPYPVSKEKVKEIYQHIENLEGVTFVEHVTWLETKLIKK